MDNPIQENGSAPGRGRFPPAAVWPSCYHSAAPSVSGKPC